MRTSNDKVRALRDQLPELVGELVGDTSFSIMGIPLPIGELVGMVSPMIEGEIDKLAQLPTHELDAQLDRAAAFVRGLSTDRQCGCGAIATWRSDTYAAVYGSEPTDYCDAHGPNTPPSDA